MFLGGETMLLFGHRGYSDQYPENTMLAFEKAIEMVLMELKQMFIKQKMAFLFYAMMKK